MGNKTSSGISQYGHIIPAVVIYKLSVYYLFVEITLQLVPNFNQQATFTNIKGNLFNKYNYLASQDIPILYIL